MKLEQRGFGRLQLFLRVCHRVLVHQKATRHERQGAQGDEQAYLELLVAIQIKVVLPVELLQAPLCQALPEPLVGVLGLGVGEEGHAWWCHSPR